MIVYLTQTFPKISGRLFVKSCLDPNMACCLAKASQNSCLKRHARIKEKKKK
jgi:hypothetical protein